MRKFLKAIAIVCMTIAILGAAAALALAGVAADASPNVSADVYPAPPGSCAPWKHISNPVFDQVEEYIQEDGYEFCYVLVFDSVRRADDPWVFVQDSCWKDVFDGYRCVEGMGTRSIKVYASSDMDAVTLFVTSKAFIPGVMRGYPGW